VTGTPGPGRPVAGDAARAGPGAGEDRQVRLRLLLAHVKEYTAGFFRAACDWMQTQQSMSRPGSALEYELWSLEDLAARGAPGSGWLPGSMSTTFSAGTWRSG
jgi:hypothetical protein